MCSLCSILLPLPCYVQFLLCSPAASSSLIILLWIYSVSFPLCLTFMYLVFSCFPVLVLLVYSLSPFSLSLYFMQPKIKGLFFVLLRLLSLHLGPLSPFYAVCQCRPDNIWSILLLEQLKL